MILDKSEYDKIHDELLDSWYFDALKPIPILSVSEWADRYRILTTKTSAEPGQWRTSRTPYSKEIMDCLSDNHPAREVIFKKSSQVGGTEILLNWLAYTIDYSPAPIMIVWPRSEDAKRNSKLRIDPLVEESESLAKKIGASKSRDSNNTLLQKGFPGGELVITGANSAAGLRSMPVRKLGLDEVDGYPFDLEGEGDPVSLAIARTKTFARKKIFICSTPTKKNASRIEIEYENSDQRYFELPCPDCGTFQHLEFKNLQWDENQPETVKYYCKECGVGIEEPQKTDMLAAGKWVAKNPDNPRIGFFINALYSPVGWYSWQDMAAEYDAAVEEARKTKKYEKLKTFYNTSLGETFEEPGESPEWEKIYRRREEYKLGTLNEKACVLTAGVDIQKNRIEMEVVAWGKGLESWSVDYKVLEGDTTKEEVWNKLAEEIKETYSMEGGDSLPIRMVAVDSGYNTQYVYKFCRQFPSTHVVPIKGANNYMRAIGTPKAVDYRFNGKLIKRRGVQVWTLGVDILKNEVYGFLKLDTPISEDELYPEGYCHFPEYDQEYFKQLTAEKVVTKLNTKGYAVQEWVKDRERNEALDCRVYARGAVAILGVDRYSPERWDALRQKMGVAQPINSVKNNSKAGTSTKTKKVRKRRASSYL